MLIWYIYISDVSARNCLVSADNRIKVGDYGISRKLFRVNTHTSKLFLYIL